MRYLLLLFAFIYSSFSYSAVYKCTVAGKVTYSGTPCEAGPAVKIKTWETSGMGDGGALEKSIEVKTQAAQVEAASGREKAIQRQAALDQLKMMDQKLTNLLAVSDRTARIALPPLVQQLQGIRDQVASLSLHVCASDAQKSLAKSAALHTESFLQFMSKNELAYSDISLKAGEAHKKYLDELRWCS